MGDISPRFKLDSRIEAHSLTEPSAYELNYGFDSNEMVSHKMTTAKKKMILKCKSCNEEFDSTFSVEEFSSLPEDQHQTGTLHLCPHCGNLSIYGLSDYKEPNGS